MVKQLLPFDLRSRACQRKFKKLLKGKTDSVAEYHLNMKSTFAVLNATDHSKLLNDCAAVSAMLKNDQYCTLGVILDNKFNRNRPALRMVKRHCNENEISIEIRKACEFSLFQNSGMDL